MSPLEHAAAVPVAWLDLPPGDYAHGTQRRGTFLDFRALTLQQRASCSSGTCGGHKCDEKKKHGGVALGLYTDGHRSSESFVSTTVVGFDVDSAGEAAARAVLADLDRRGLGYAAHSTHSGTASWRLFLPLATELRPDHWRAFRAWLRYELPELAALEDDAARDASRLWYAPTAGKAPVQFVVTEGRPLVPMLLQAVRRPGPRSQSRASGAASVDRARAYLAAAGPAVEGAGGDCKTFSLACFVVRDLGLSEVDALEVLRDWNATCVPPWSDAELEAKVTRALKYGKHEVGVAL